MLTLKGKTVYLRALEPEDLEFIYTIENDESIWEVSNTQTPYSKFLIKQYLQNAHQDIYEAKQLRLAICENQNKNSFSHNFCGKVKNKINFHTLSVGKLKLKSIFPQLLWESEK